MFSAIPGGCGWCCWGKYPFTWRAAAHVDPALWTAMDNHLALKKVQLQSWSLSRYLNRKTPRSITSRKVHGTLLLPRICSRIWSPTCCFSGEISPSLVPKPQNYVFQNVDISFPPVSVSSFLCFSHLEIHNEESWLLRNKGHESSWHCCSPGRKEEEKATIWCQFGPLLHRWVI